MVAKEYFSFEEANNKIGEIIACAINIEELVSKVITNFFEPKKNKLFEEIILNSSIVSYGQKLKILSNIENYDAKFIEKLRKIGALRNSVAHNNLFINNMNEVLKKDIDFMYESVTLNVMNSSGKLIKKNFNELIEEFFIIYDELVIVLDKEH